jgi:hypothetical protein
MLPGVITPAPFTNTPVKVALAPAVMVAGVATKLVMEGTGGGGVVVEPDEPPQPARLPRHTLIATAHAIGARIRFIGFPGYSKFRQIESQT